MFVRKLRPNIIKLDSRLSERKFIELFNPRLCYINDQFIVSKALSSQASQNNSEWLLWQLHNNWACFNFTGYMKQVTMENCFSFPAACKWPRRVHFIPVAFIGSFQTCCTKKLSRIFYKNKLSPGLVLKSVCSFSSGWSIVECSCKHLINNNLTRYDETVKSGWFVSISNFHDLTKLHYREHFANFLIVFFYELFIIQRKSIIRSLGRHDDEWLWQNHPQSTSASC